MSILDTFTSLNPIEEFFATDNIEEVKQLEMEFSPRFSEICAHYGSQKCLDYMIEKEMPLSPLVNLYLIKRGQAPLSFLHHRGELYFILYYDKHDMLPLIELPSIDVAFKTMMKMMQENAFDTIDHARIIYELYTPGEWTRYISGLASKVITLLLQTDKLYLLRNVRVKSSTIKMVLETAPDRLDTLKEICILPVVCKAYHKETLADMRQYGLYACKTNMRRKRSK